MGDLAPGLGAQAQGINQEGDVFGTAPISLLYGQPQNHIFFWSQAGGMIDVGLLPDTGLPTSYSLPGNPTAIAMNDAGQVVGTDEVQAANYSLNGGFAVLHAFLWTPAQDRKSGTLVDLGTLSAPGTSQAVLPVAINARGQVVGTAGSPESQPTGNAGFLWTPGGTNGVASNPSMVSLGNFQPLFLDDAGRCLGWQNGTVTIYDGQNFTALGNPPGYPGGSLYLSQWDARGDFYGTFLTDSSQTIPFAWIPAVPHGVTGQYVLGEAAPGQYQTPADALPPALFPVGADVFTSYPSMFGNCTFAYEPHVGRVEYLNPGGILFESDSLTQDQSTWDYLKDWPPFDPDVLATNASGDLVGSDYHSELALSRAFVVTGGLMYDLTRRLTGTGAGTVVLDSAVGINDAGQIVANGGGSAYRLIAAGQAQDPPAISNTYPFQIVEGDPLPPFVDLTGSGFAVGATVTWDGAAIQAAVFSETQILVYPTAAQLLAGTHAIIVTDPGGQSASASYAVAPRRPYPTLASASPASVPVGSPDTVVTLTGTGLYLDTLVEGQYGAYGPFTVKSVSADHTSAQIIVPATLLASAVEFPFIAYNFNQRGPQNPYTQPTLTVLDPVPTITSIVPASLAADTVSNLQITIQGTNFVPGTQFSTGQPTQILLSGHYVQTTYISPTELMASLSDADTLPVGPAVFKVVNAAPGGGTATATLTVTNGPNPVPTITSLSPNPTFGPFNSVEQITINGTGFQHTSRVRIGTLNLTVTSLQNNHTQITVTLPGTGLTPGQYPVTVTNPVPAGGTSNVVTLTVNPAPQPPVTLYALSYQNTQYLLTDDPALYASLTASGWTGAPTGRVYANATDAPGIVPLYKLLYPATNDRFYTTDPNQRASLISQGWQDKGVVCYLYAAQAPGTVPLLRALNTQTGLHLFTGDPGQYAALLPPWSQRGTAAYLLPLPPQPPVPLYALTAQNTQYLLTDDASVASSLTAGGWTGGPTGHVYANPYDAPGIVPLFKLLASGSNDRFYTTDPNQFASLVASGAWQNKGVCCYVYATQVSGTVPLYRALNTQTNLHLFTGSAAQYNALLPPWSLRGVAAYILP